MRRARIARARRAVDHLWIVWTASFVLLVCQGWRSFGAPERFVDLPSLERLEWVERAWGDEQVDPERFLGTRLGVVVLLGAGLVHLLGTVNQEVLAWMAHPDLMSPARFAGGLLGVWVAGFFLYQIVHGHWAARRLTMARDFLVFPLEDWRERGLHLFREHVARRLDLAPDVPPILLTSTRRAPGNLPYRSLRRTALALGDEGFLLARSPPFDARVETQYLAVDRTYRPRFELSLEEVEEVPYGDVLAVDLRTSRRDPGCAEVLLSLTSGQTRTLRGDVEGAGMAAGALRAQLRTFRSCQERRGPAGVVHLEHHAGRGWEEAMPSPTDASRRECPECAELIRLRARRCRFCGCDALAGLPQAS